MEERYENFKFFYNGTGASFLFLFSGFENHCYGIKMLQIFDQFIAVLCNFNTRFD